MKEVSKDFIDEDKEKDDKKEQEFIKICTRTSLQCISIKSGNLCGSETTCPHVKILRKELI